MPGMKYRDLFEVCSRGFIRFERAAGPLIESTAVGTAVCYSTIVVLKSVFGAAATTSIGAVAVPVVAIAVGIRFGRVMLVGSRRYSENRLVRPLNDYREQIGLPKITHR